jgi:prepilin-type N-terminal cleavage/methylation domain-containing protein
MTEPGKYGFTLLEVLVAMTILSVTLLTLLSTFRTVSTSSERIKNEIRRQERIQQCLDVITADLEQIYLPRPPRYHPPDHNQPPDPYRFLGTEDGIDGVYFSHLQFSSLNHLDLGPGHLPGAGRIHYYVHRHENRFDLHRFDGTFLSDAAPDPCIDPVLIKDIDVFSVTFTDAEGTDQTAWDSESDRFDHTFPVRVTIALAPAENGTSETIRATVHIPVSRRVNQ